MLNPGDYGDDLLDAADRAARENPDDDLLARGSMRRQLGADALEGDSADAGGWAGLVASLISAGGNIAATEMKKKEDATAATAKANAEALQKQVSGESDADAGARSARKTADEAAEAAADAAKKADGEKDKRGPLHKAAARAMQVANLLDASAKTAEAKSAVFHPAPTAAPKPAKGWLGSVPTWGWAIGAGILGVGLLALLVRRRPSAPAPKKLGGVR